LKTYRTIQRVHNVFLKDLPLQFSWQLDCKRFITNRGDIITQPRTDDVTSIGDGTFAIQLPSSANRPTINQRTRATYIPQHCRLNVLCRMTDYRDSVMVVKSNDGVVNDATNFNRTVASLKFFMNQWSWQSVTKVHLILLALRIMKGIFNSLCCGYSDEIQQSQQYTTNISPIYTIEFTDRIPQVTINVTTYTLYCVEYRFAFSSVAIRRPYWSTSFLIYVTTKPYSIVSASYKKCDAEKSSSACKHEAAKHGAVGDGRKGSTGSEKVWEAYLDRNVEFRTCRLAIYASNRSVAWLFRVARLQPMTFDKKVCKLASQVFGTLMLTHKSSNRPYPISSDCTHEQNGGSNDPASAKCAQAKKDLFFSLMTSACQPYSSLLQTFEMSFSQSWRTGGGNSSFERYVYVHVSGNKVHSRLTRFEINGESEQFVGILKRYKLLLHRVQGRFEHRGCLRSLIIRTPTEATYSLFGEFPINLDRQVSREQEGCNVSDLFDDVKLVRSSLFGAVHQQFGDICMTFSNTDLTNASLSSYISLHLGELAKQLSETKQGVVCSLSDEDSKCQLIERWKKTAGVGALTVSQPTYNHELVRQRRSLWQKISQRSLSQQYSSQLSRFGITTFYICLNCYTLDSRSNGLDWHHRCYIAVFGCRRNETITQSIREEMQLNVLHQAASCFICYDIRDIAIHVYSWKHHKRGIHLDFRFCSSTLFVIKRYSSRFLNPVKRVMSELMAMEASTPDAVFTSSGISRCGFHQAISNDVFSCDGNVRSLRAFSGYRRSLADIRFRRIRDPIWLVRRNDEQQYPVETFVMDKLAAQAIDLLPQVAISYYLYVPFQCEEQDDLEDFLA
ncbi:hypothetical protein CLF_104531, partial [Clonorchis sinensis]